MFHHFEKIVTVSIYISLALCVVSYALGYPLLGFVSLLALGVLFYIGSSFFSYMRKIKSENYSLGFNAGTAFQTSPSAPAAPSTIDIQTIVRINKLKDCTTAQQINSLHYYFSGRHYYASPGTAENHLSEITHAILQGNKQFYLCTTNHGALRGRPVIIHQKNIISVNGNQQLQTSP